VLGERFNLYVLAVVVGILVAGVVASVWADRRDGRGRRRGSPVGQAAV
jgi:hypothetical protein